MIYFFVLLLATVTLATPSIVDARGNGFGMNGGKKGKMGAKADREASETSNSPEVSPEHAAAFYPMKGKLDAMEQYGFLATGLTAVYPDDYACPPARSAFASASRSDGSQRSAKFFQGLHGGMDIPQPGGTPLIALADGEVVVKHEGEGEGIGGLGIWLRLAPEDTGLSKYVFVEYKHLAKMPDFEVGTRVKMGQVIGETGNTGTQDGYYGANGFYHLHMTAYWSDTPDFIFTRTLVPTHGQWLDPLALMRGEPLDSHAARDLPDVGKKVRIPFKTADGKVIPDNARIIWPYICAPK